MPDAIIFFQSLLLIKFQAGICEIVLFNISL